MTIPYITITQAHYDAAVDFLFAPKMNKLDIINKANEIALAEYEAFYKPFKCSSCYTHPPAPRKQITAEDIRLMAFNDCSDDWNSLDCKEIWLEGYVSGAAAVNAYISAKSNAPLKMLSVAEIDDLNHGFKNYEDAVKAFCEKNNLTLEKL